MRLPPHPFLRAILLRSVVIWIGVRAAASLGTLMLPFRIAGQNPYSISPAAVIVVVLMTAALTRLDCDRHNETVFLANLGVRGATVFGLAALCPLLFQLTEAVLVGT